MTKPASHRALPWGVVIYTYVSNESIGESNPRIPIPIVGRATTTPEDSYGTTPLERKEEGELPRDACALAARQFASLAPVLLSSCADGVHDCWHGLLGGASNDVPANTELQQLPHIRGNRKGFQ